MTAAQRSREEQPLLCICTGINWDGSEPLGLPSFGRSRQRKALPSGCARVVEVRGNTCQTRGIHRSAEGGSAATAHLLLLSSGVTPVMNYTFIKYVVNYRKGCIFYPQSPFHIPEHPRTVLLVKNCKCITAPHHSVGNWEVKAVLRVVCSFCWESPLPLFVE